MLLRRVSDVRCLRRVRLLTPLGAPVVDNNAAQCAIQTSQYTRLAPSRRRNKPPQRSQYFNSIGLSVPSILFMKFMIASSKMNDYKTRKALAPIVRPRARFSYDDLYGYLVVIAWLLQLSDSIRFHVSEISFLIPGLEDLPILKDHTQASGEPKVLQQSQHRC